MRGHDTERADMRRLNYFEHESRNASNMYALQEDTDDEDVRVSPMQQDTSDGRLARPGSIRTSTDPPSAALLQGSFAMNVAAQSTTPRTRSPFSKSHLRSRSSGAANGLPRMVRAHSMPAVHSLMRVSEHTPVISSASTSGSQSPLPSPARLRSPLATPDASHTDASYFPPPPRSPHWFETANGGPIEIIQEDSELDLTPRNSSAYSPSMPNPPPMALATRSSGGNTRRRPVSPLHSATTVTSAPAIVSPEQDSPAFLPTKFTESFPSSFQLHHYASTSSFSSISTPSSARSRSPSINSLDTIEDVPDAEDEALEADRLWRLQLDSKGERSDDMGDDGYRRKGFGFGRGRNSERKRWSVCGGERRADLDLETIWED